MESAMGTFNNFRELKEYAEKLIKYKQDVSFEAACRCGIIKTEHFELVKGGSCNALVLGWLGQKLGGVQLFHRKERKPAGSDEDSAIVAGMFSQYQFLYKTFASRIGAVRATREIAKEFNLSFCEKKLRHLETFQSVWLDLVTCTKPAQLCYIAAAVKGQACGGHAMGAFRAPDERLHFFDPNVGEYKIHAGENAERVFFNAYTGLVKEQLKWEYEATWWCPVERAQA
jgi:hypothetical protein